MEVFPIGAASSVGLFFLFCLFAFYLFRPFFFFAFWADGMRCVGQRWLFFVVTRNSAKSGMPHPLVIDYNTVQFYDPERKREKVGAEHGYGKLYSMYSMCMCMCGWVDACTVVLSNIYTA